MSTNTDRLARKIRQAEGIVTRNVAGETVLVPIRGAVADLQRIFTLDETSRFIWDQLDGARSLATVADAVVATFAVEADTARADLLAYVGELEAAGLVVEQS